MSNETTTTATLATPTPTEQLISLNAQIDAALDAASNATDRQAKLDANLELFKLQQSVRTVENAIAKEARDKEVSEKRNARVALYDNSITLYDTHISAQKSKTLTIDEKNAAYDAYKSARETVVNELLQKHPTSTPSTRATGDASAPKGEKSLAIRKIITDEIASGKSMAEAKKTAEAAGYTRGTVGTIATEILKSQEATV